MPTHAVAGMEGRTPITVPEVPRMFGFAVRWRQTLAIAWDSFRTITKSWAGLALLAGIPIPSVLMLLDDLERNGVPLVPTTARVINESTPALADNRWVVIPLLIIFLAGELVWRERDAGLGEITDAMPGSEWAPFAREEVLGDLLEHWNRDVLQHDRPDDLVEGRQARIRLAAEVMV